MLKRCMHKLLYSLKFGIFLACRIGIKVCKALCKIDKRLAMVLNTSMILSLCRSTRRPRDASR